MLPKDSSCGCVLSRGACFVKLAGRGGMGGGVALVLGLMSVPMLLSVLSCGRGGGGGGGGGTAFFLSSGISEVRDN